MTGKLRSFILIGLRLAFLGFCGLLAHDLIRVENIRQTIVNTPVTNTQDQLKLRDNIAELLKVEPLNVGIPFILTNFSTYEPQERAALFLEALQRNPRNKTVLNASVIFFLETEQTEHLIDVISVQYTIEEGRREDHLALLSKLLAGPRSLNDMTTALSENPAWARPLLETVTQSDDISGAHLSAGLNAYLGSSARERDKQAVLQQYMYYLFRAGQFKAAAQYWQDHIDPADQKYLDASTVNFNPGFADLKYGDPFNYYLVPHRDVTTDFVFDGLYVKFRGDHEQLLLRQRFAWPDTPYVAFALDYTGVEKREDNSFTVEFWCYRGRGALETIKITASDGVEGRFQTPDCPLGHVELKVRPGRFTENVDMILSRLSIRGAD